MFMLSVYKHYNIACDKFKQTHMKHIIYNIASKSWYP